MTSRRPRTGGRVVLERLAADGDGARYRVTLLLPEAEHVAEAGLARGRKAAEWTAWEPAGPPDWLAQAAQAFLDGVRRDAERTPDAPWPGRLAYWRPYRA